MYCPSCGNQIPDRSTFCLHCGVRIDTPGADPAVGWEYKDFVYIYPEGRRPKRGALSIVQTRNHIWSGQQSFLFSKVQEWLDDGWEPITAIGPSGFEWRSYKELDLNPLGGTFLARYPVEEVVAFRVKMRRPRR
jgi:hypothetical protein